MKNTRNNGQKRVKNCLKWTASGLLLALLFVLVFAGTLSGAFGIENELQQNGIIQSNVASAASGYANNAFNFSESDFGKTVDIPISSSVSSNYHTYKTESNSTTTFGEYSYENKTYLGFYKRNNSKDTKTYGNRSVVSLQVNLPANTQKVGVSFNKLTITQKMTDTTAQTSVGGGTTSTGSYGHTIDSDFSITTSLQSNDSDFGAEGTRLIDKDLEKCGNGSDAGRFITGPLEYSYSIDVSKLTTSNGMKTIYLRFSDYYWKDKGGTTSVAQHAWGLFSNLKVYAHYVEYGTIIESNFDMGKDHDIPIESIENGDWKFGKESGNAILNADFNQRNDKGFNTRRVKFDKGQKIADPTGNMLKVAWNGTSELRGPFTYEENGLSGRSIGINAMSGDDECGEAMLTLSTNIKVPKSITEVRLKADVFAAMTSIEGPPHNTEYGLYLYEGKDITTGTPLAYQEDKIKESNSSSTVVEKKLTPVDLSADVSNVVASSDGYRTITLVLKMKAIKRDKQYAGDMSAHMLLMYNLKMSYIGHYQIAYAGNNSTSGSMENQVVLYGNKSPLNINQFERERYEFVEWNTNADGSGTKFADGASIIPDLTAKPSKTDENGTIVYLYAQWQEAFLLIYHSNVGPNNDSIVKHYEQFGEPIELYSAGHFGENQPLSSFRKNGYYFAGWADTNNSDTALPSPIIAGGNGQNSQDIYAIWKPIKYTVRFGGNGASVGEMSVINGYFSNADLTLPANQYHKDDAFFETWSVTISDKTSELENSTDEPAVVTIGKSTFAEMLTRLQTNIETQSVSFQLNVVWATGFEFGNYANGVGKWGSQTNPYVIRTLQHLTNLSSIIENGTGLSGSMTGSQRAWITNPQAINGDGYKDSYFVLADNIADVGNITPIGVNTHPFKGNFDGNNKTIGGLSINKAGNYVGLFGCITDATIKDLSVNGMVKGSQYVGGVVGYALNSTIENVTNNASVEGDTSVGGVVGYSDSTSRMYGTIVNSGNITANSMVGGVSGENHGFWCDTNSNYGTFKNSGSINGRNGATVGGVTAFADKEMHNAVNTGNVIGGNAVGGVAGRVQAPIKNSYNSGEIVGTNPTIQGEITGNPNGVFVGGITGYTTDKGTISNCYNTGTIAAHSASNGYIDNGDYVGGIVGFAQAKVEYCANIGGLIDGNNFIGGIVGSALSTTKIFHCYDVQGQRQFRWKGCNHGAITGNGGNVTNSWAINEKSLESWNNTENQTSASTKNRALTTPTTTDFEVVPQFYDGVNYVNKVWTNILDTNINGFSVSGGVDPSKSQFFESKKGSNSNSEYLTPNKTENSNQENALDRDNEASFTVTAWYGAATESDIYCAVNTINIDTSADTYNGNQHGFTRSDVTTPGKSGSVYGIVFDYKGKNPNEIFVCAFDSNGNIVAGSTNPTQVDTYNTTVFVKIGDIVVGKKINVDYTINKATLDVGWEWTDKLHSNLYNRTGDGNKEVQFVYNRQEQGLSSISDHLKNAALFKVTGSEWTNIDAATYERTYTLIDTRNYKLNFTNSNTGLTDSATSVEFKWTIRKNKLTVYNYWTGDDLNPSSEFYTFEFNTTHQGLKLQDGIKVGVEPDTSGNSHKIATDAYEIAQGVECIAANTADTSYTRTFTIKDTTNYEVEKIYSFNTNLLPNQKGVAVNAEKSVVTYTWKIVPFDLAANINKGNVWFGGATDLVVSNQGIANVEVGNQSYPDMRFYPLQADKKGTQGVQQVLVYAQYNYTADNFVLYVKYNNGNVFPLTLDTEYTVGTLDKNNTFGTFDVNVVSQTKPVDETNVTAKGTGNFSGIVTKYYTAMYSDFGGKVTSDNWGSQGNPYVISTPEQLLRLSQIVNGGKAWNSINTTNTDVCISPQGTEVATDRAYSGAYFKVDKDIDMSGFDSTDGVYNFLPIGHKQGNGDMPFSGNFNGKKDDNTNFQITFKYDITGVDYVGLFGYLNGATVQNVNVTSGATVKGGNYVGLVAGYAINSTLFNALGKYGGTVEGTGDYVGGIVGYAENTTIQSSGAASNAQVKGRFYVGGIVGKWIVHSEAQIGGSKAGQASITPASNQQIHGVKYVGGLVGWLDTSKCDASVEYTPQLKNTGHTIGVFGTEYVGALFGALIGNGYHKEQKTATGGAIYTAIGIDSGKVGNIKLGTRVYGDGGTTYQPKVVGGLVGYVESAGLAFLSDWNTANISFEFSYTVGNVTQFTEPSFFGGVVGVLGQNATMEAPYESKDDGSFLFGASYMITNNTEFGASNPLGSFVGGIVGYVSSQAGTYWESTTTIFGNGIALVNSANIYATGYVGGIFGALGDIVVDDAVCNEINAGEGDEYKNILKKVVASGVRTGNANTTLGIAPATKSEWVDNAVGKLHNMASVSATGKYVGGILGYSGAKVRVVLRNAPQNGAVDLSKLHVYSAGTNVTISGSYAGGIAGYLSFGLDHELQYVVVQAKFANANATRVGGLVGYMGSGKVERCVVTSPDGTISASTDNYQGTEYVGGLVGETQTAIIRNSVSTGFKLAQTTNTKGGLLGYGSNPTLEASWTFYVAQQGATYSTVSKNTYGKYILVDSEIIVTNGSSYPPFADLCKFVGLVANADVDRLNFAVKVPSATDSDTLKNKQLAFYNASGNDVVTSNIDSFEDFVNNNNILTIKLNMASGTSMQICAVKIEFVNVPQSTTSNDDAARKLVAGKYKKPSNSTRYVVQVTKAEFDIGNTNQVTHITANVYFQCNDRLVVVSNGYDSQRRIGSYDKDLGVPGSSAENPLTISSQKEWNDFAHSVYDGNAYENKFIKLLEDVNVTGGYTNFANNGGYNFAGDVTATDNTKNFKGTFDGNGKKIIVTFSGIKMDGASVFPNAAAIFRNLTIDGTIKSNKATSDTDYANKWEAGKYVAGFVGKPQGQVAFYNCTNLAEVYGLKNVGGFVGHSDHTIIAVACVNKGDIYSAAGINKESFKEKEYKSTFENDIETGDTFEDRYVNVTFGTGGIIGNSEKQQTIESCMNTGNISGGHNVGGIIGRANEDLVIKNCANVGNIVAHSGAEKYGGEDDDSATYLVLSYVGGLVGKTSRRGTIDMDASYNTGTVTAWGSISGGLIGSVGDYIFNAPTATGTGTDETKHADALAKIQRCYNAGLVQSGGTHAKPSIVRAGGRLEVAGSVSGGIVGSLAHSEISYCYNIGEVIIHTLIGGQYTWQARVGGIAGQVLPNKGKNEFVRFNSCYNAGYITLETHGENYTFAGITAASPRYGASISGYCDNDDSAKLVSDENCFGLGYTIRYRDTYRKKEYIYTNYNKYNTGNYWSDIYMKWGTTIESLAGFTSVMQSDGTVKPNSAFGNTHVANASDLKGYIYMPGCLPQLAVFGVDTRNGLSMNSIVYGENNYGEYVPLAAGTRGNPYILKDGIDMLGMHALTDAGYTFDNKYLEFANGKNNITLDSEDKSVVSKEIDLPTYNSTTDKLPSDTTAYKSKGAIGTYEQKGRSYHLFENGALAGTALIVAAQKDLNTAVPHKGGSSTITSIEVENKKTEGVNDAYVAWLGGNHYYNGASGSMSANATPEKQNFISIGRYGKYYDENNVLQDRTFKGSISGKQDGDTNTVINNLRISSGKTTGAAFGGLFGHIDNAYVGYVEVGGESNVWAYSSDNQQIVASGAIAGYATGKSVIEHCAASGTTAIGAYGKTNATQITSDITFAGGIVGLANPKKGTQYEAGISTIIKGCTVNISTTTDDRAAFAGIIQACKSNIGGVLGYVEGDKGALGKGNSVRIEGCKVQKAAIQAANGAKTSSHIGGVLGYGSEFVPAFITGCEVGTDTGTVTIKGEHSLGGIAGGMSNAKGGYIDSCMVGANTTIERIDQGGDASVSENPKHGTAIGGLVGFTEDSTDAISPLTTTFSGTSSFLGTINVTVAATNSAGFDAAISQIGGIVGDMGSGAHFASGSDVTVGGAINIKNVANDGLAAANVGGVAGRTSNATFIGKFDVRPTMTTPLTENVGGFIGKNVGTVYILADTTERIVDGKLNGTAITIGGKITGTSEVGGFIGVNNSGSSLNIGSNVANAKPYTSGTLSITIATGAEISGSGNNVGGIVGKNEGAVDTEKNDYATIDIVKGTIEQNGTISGKNYVGGIIGLNAGLLTTGGGEAESTIGGIALDENQIGDIKNLLITNKGNVKGGVTENNNYVGGDCVGGVIGWLDAPQTLRPEHTGKGDIAGAFTNKGSVEGNRFVGGSLGYVGKYVNIVAKGDVDTLFSNTGNVTAHSTFVGGSIGAIVGQITGVDSKTTVNFENTGTVNGLGYVGGSIGVLAGPAAFAQFVNSSTQDFPIAACNSVGGSVGYIGMPDALKAVLDAYFKDNTYSDIDITVQNVHFEANGNLTAEPTDATLDAAKKDANGNDVADNLWGGVGGAIGVLGRNQLKGWVNNTYYANGSVIAPKVNNVGGIIGLINADKITIGNLLAYNITVTGAKNVGGIVGATNGENTKILSAYTIEGTFSGTENVGGIIGLANSTEGKATDAKTSYWVKGYSNAVLAGADVKDLQQTLGKFETIVEQVTVNGKQQTIVFTEDFCKLYTPNTYYADYPGTHTYNGKTVTLSENAEQLTWDTYFKTNLGETSAQTQNGAWVKPVANAVTFTTGTEKTGWYFAFANDANGANGLGTINTNHHKDGGKNELKYWKRIANAYTAQERADNKDTGDLVPPSNIVSGGQPQYATLYATATAAGEDSGYYLYMATSGQSRPTATYSTDKFFIQVLTTTTTRAELAQNVAIYYRTISKGKTLTYNGYLRYAPVGITVDDGKTVPYVQTPQQDATKKDTYCYSADTTTNGNATGGAQIDPGNYESAVKIYYYDKDGNPYVVGGVAIKWEIKARQLSSEISANIDRVYGAARQQDGASGADKHDMKVLVSNIAPNKGTPPQFVITVKDTSSSPNIVTTFTYTGNTLSETKNGITLTATSVGDASKNGWETNDNLYNVDVPNDKITKEVLFYIDFTNAKTYNVTVEPDTDTWKKRYTLNATKDFSVKPAELKITGVGQDSVKFDNKGHGYSWKITGFKYEDGMEVLAAFSPMAYALGKSAPLYKSATELLTSDVTINDVADVKFNVQATSKEIAISGAKLKGSYYIGFATLKAGNYTLKLEGGVESERKSKAFAISDNKFTFEWSNSSSHVYNKKSGTITLTITTDVPLEGFDTFIANFFSFTMTRPGNVALAQSSGNQSVVVTFTSGVNAGTYTAQTSENAEAEAKKFRETYKSSCSYPNLPQSRTWTITKRELTFTLGTTLNSQSYTYNANHQGLSTIRVNGESGDIGLLSGDSVTASWSVVRSGDTGVFRYGTATTTTSSTNNVSGLNTINHGTYTATVTLNNTNYTATEKTISWTIDKYTLKFSDLADGEKIYDGTAVTPTLKVNGVEITNGQYAPLGEIINIVYSIKEGNTNHNSLVNAGIYEISVGGNTAITSASVRDNMNVADNYAVTGSLSADYKITPRQIKLTWETTQSFVFNDKEQGLRVLGVAGVNGTEHLAVQNSTSTINGVQLTGYAGKDTIVLSISGAIKNVNDPKAHMTAVISNVFGKNADNVSSSDEKNYEIVDNTNVSGEFAITPSKLKIFYANGTTSKVYDATTTVKDNNFTFTVSSTNGGAHGNVKMFDITKTYDDKNVSNDYTKTVTFGYKFVSTDGNYVFDSTDSNYVLDGSGHPTQAVQGVGKITPAHIKVALNRLRSGKATRTFTNDVWYGGKDGASGNVNSTVYRSGEGFTVSGVLSSDAIKVVAEYREADDSRNGTGNSFNLSSYVNDVEEKDGTFDMAAAGTHYFKTLVFTMTGTDAKNYTFNVYGNGTDGKKYSEKDSTAGDTQTVTVYDTDDKANGHQNASGAEQIHIEITVKSVRVTYDHTAQSYANNDNTYNTAWDRVTGTNQDMQGAGADIVVTNGWMYIDGKDRPADSTEPKREYHGYTTIRGNATSQLLGASVSKKDGMNLNYRLSNQPTLTIAYFVDNTGTYEIDTLARLLIASFYYTAHQNPGDQIFMQIVKSGYKWFKVVKGEDYSQVEFAVPENSPITVADTINSWDAYINALNEAGYAVFYNETEKAWGCYVSDSSQSTSLPNSYKLTKDISGKFTADDIRVLDAFFTVTTTDDNGQSTTTKYTWNGANSDYLQNVLSAAVDKVATVNGSLFVSTQKAEGTTSPMGFDGTFDGNGYVIEYLNIMGYGKENVGLFDIIGANGIVKNLHLRNITINANKGNVGGIAGSIAATEGDADATKNVTNVSFHGKITASGSNVGGLFGTSARAIAGAIVLGEISATNANVGGVVGTLTATASLSNVVSMMQITAIGGTVGVFASTQNPTIGNSFHMKNAVWKRPTSGTGFVNVVGKNVNYNALMSGSNSLYANGTSESGTYDVIDETFADSGQNVNPRQSKRLRDMVSVYLLMYSLSVNNGKYTISSSSWLVGTADGTTANPIAIANKQNVSLLRELRFATFTLKANVSIDVARTFTGAFYGSVTSAVNESGVSYGYKITCNKSMFEEYATVPTAWLVTPTQP